MASYLTLFRQVSILDMIILGSYIARPYPIGLSVIRHS